MMAHLHLHLALLLLLLFLLLCFSPQTTLSLWWPSSPPPSSSNDEPQSAEFTMQGLSDSKGVKVVEDARRKMVAPNTCWHNSYRALFESCSEIMSSEEKKKRLAWMLGDCFQKDSGRPAFPNCKGNAPMVQCLKRLDDSEHKTFLEFFIETNSICHQLQLSHLLLFFSYQLFLMIGNILNP